MTHRTAFRLSMSVLASVAMVALSAASPVAQGTSAPAQVDLAVTGVGARTSNGTGAEAVLPVLGQKGASKASAALASQSGGAILQPGSAIRPGFNSFTYGPNDDGTYPCTGPESGVPGGETCPNGPTPVPLPFTVDWYGHSYSGLYINTNGNVTFGQPFSQFTPQSMNQIGVPMIAPFWADVDTRTGPVMSFGAGTVNGHKAFGVNWLGVGCFNKNNSVADYFQLVLIDIASGAFDIEFNYGTIAWDSGQASGGNGQCLGGTAARAGYTSGFGESYELPGSGVDGGLLSSNAQTGLPNHSMGSEGSGPTFLGRYVFDIGNGGYPNGPGYVAMGDSYSSGYGTGIPATVALNPTDLNDPNIFFNLAGNPCDRTTQAWPMLMSAEYIASPELFASNAPASPPLYLGNLNNAFIACSGDTTSQLRWGEYSKQIPSQITQLANYETVHGYPGLVTVTVGGDDLGFVGVLEDCFLTLAEPGRCLVDLDNTIAYLQSGAFTPILAGTYAAIKAQAGDAEVVAVGYPFLFPTASLRNETDANAHCSWLEDDAYQVLPQFENGQLDLDAVMRQAANEAGIRFVALDDVFAGNELCTGDSYINSIKPPQFGTQPGHPNEAGQQAIATAVAGQLGYLPGTGGQGGIASSAASSVPKPAKHVLSSRQVAGAVGNAALSAATSAPVQAATSGPVTLTAGLTAGELSVPYNGPVWVTGGTEPYSWAVTSGYLPAGLSLDAITGIISGTPAATGTSSFTVTATDSSSPTLSASAALAITIGPVPALAVQAPAVPQPTVGQSYTASLSATGGIAPYSWSVTSGSLPAGLSIDASTGDITGVPTTSGPSSFTATATDSSVSATTASESYTLDVVPAGSPMEASTPLLGTGEQGVGYNGQLTSTGGTAPVYWSITSGALPDGLNLDPGTGQVTGIPTGSGTYQFTAQVQDATAPTSQVANEQLSITIDPGTPVSVFGQNLPDASVGAPYSGAVNVQGGVAPYSYSVSSGALPSGLSLDPSSGAISGSPTATGTYSFGVTATDSATPDAGTATQDFDLNVAPAPAPPAMTVSDTAGPTTVGAPYSASLVPDGGTGPYSFQVSSGALPPGISLDPSGGDLTGAATTIGSYTATVTVTDSSQPTSQTATDTLSIDVSTPGPLVIATSTLGDANVGSVYSGPITVNGGTAPYSFSVSSGSLPDGLSLDADAGVVTGTPTGTGLSSFTVTVTDNTSPTPETTSMALTVTVDPEQPVSLATVSLPDASQGIAYSQVVAASGGTGPYSFSISSGSLPDGLSLDPSAGVMSGTPTGTGTASFTVEVTDSSAPPQSANEDLSLAVDPSSPLGVTTTALTPATEGSSYSADFDTDGGTGQLTWSLANGALPPGLSLDPSSGTIGGTPVGYGTYNFQVQVTDSSTPTAQEAVQTLSLEVVPARGVQPLAGSSSILSVPATAVAGTSVSYRATVSGIAGTPTGSVSFSIAGSFLCTATLSNGSGSCSSSGAPTGTDTVIGTYSGDTGFASSNASEVLVVTPSASPTSSTTTTASPPPVGGGGLPPVGTTTTRQSTTTTSSTTTTTTRATTTTTVVTRGKSHVAPVVKVLIASTKLLSGHLTVKLSCARANCAGTVEVVVPPAGKPHQAKYDATPALVVLAKASYSALKGHIEVVGLTLTANGKKLLQNVDQRRVRTEVVVSVRGGKGVTTALWVS